MLKQVKPTDPTGTSDTIGVCMGLNVTFAPDKTGEVLILIDGSVSVDTNGASVELAIFGGPGAAPANGDRPSGSQLSANPVLTWGVAGSRIPFSLSAVANGLTLGTTYWVDLVLAAAGGIASVSKLGVTVAEI
jgi:hypothetical protein